MKTLVLTGDRVQLKEGHDKVIGTVMPIRSIQESNKIILAVTREEVWIQFDDEEPGYLEWRQKDRLKVIKKGPLHNEY